MVVLLGRRHRSLRLRLCSDTHWSLRLRLRLLAYAHLSTCTVCRVLGMRLRLDLGVSGYLRCCLCGGLRGLRCMHECMLRMCVKGLLRCLRRRLHTRQRFR